MQVLTLRGMCGNRLGPMNACSRCDSRPPQCVNYGRRSIGNCPGCDPALTGPPEGGRSVQAVDPSQSLLTGEPASEVLHIGHLAVE